MVVDAKKEFSPSVLVRVGRRGVESVTLGAQSEEQEVESLELFAKFRPAIRQIDLLLTASKEGR